MVVYETLLQLWYSFLPFLPRFLAAIALLLIGGLLGWVIGDILKNSLRRFKVDEYVARRRKPVFPISEIIYLIVFWTIFLIFTQAAVQTLGITTLVTMLNYVIAFLPGLLGAIIIVVVFYVIAEYVRRKVEESDISYSEIAGKVLFFLIIYIGIATALPLVKISTFLINAILLTIVGSLGLGIALAIGLGLKDTIAELSKKYRSKRR